MRGPDGRFVTFGCEIYTWLPVWLKRGYGNTVVNTLNVLVRHLIAEERGQIEMAARDLETEVFDSQPDRDRISDRGLIYAAKIRRQRQVIVEAIEKLKAVQNG